MADYNTKELLHMTQQDLAMLEEIAERYRARAMNEAWDRLTRQRAAACVVAINECIDALRNLQFREAARRAKERRNG